MNIEELSKIFVGDALVAASTQLLSGVPVDAGILDAATKAREALLEPMEDRARPGPKRKRGNELRAKDPDSPGQVDTVDVYATAKRANVDTKGSRRKLLERIGAQAVRNYMREQRAAASSSASASSSGAGTGAGRGVPPPPLPFETLPPPPPLPFETKPQGNILNAEGQAQADRGLALLRGDDDDGTTFD